MGKTDSRRKTRLYLDKRGTNPEVGVADLLYNNHML